MSIKKITIVEYEPKLAGPIATMWNNTKEGWNGRDFSTTKENVLVKEGSATHENLYLALDSETLNDPEPKVVGYCRLTKDQNDENALYIGLLSVLPEYFNQKVGKALVLKSIERTIELNYPRLYLYTWSGNTKAVPLYKKTGFFWEEGEDVHLVNMIPSVLKCEAVEDFFETACWYDDNKRPIEIKPDGRIENKFEFYTYYWEKDGKNLSMEYDQKGKGLRKIDCDDYTITATVCNLDLIFGRNHSIKYEIINKSGNPLNVEFKGVNDRNIEFDFHKTINVEKTESVTAEFKVNSIDKPQSPYETHPVVFTEIIINGKKAEFKTGIVPKHPITLNMNLIDSFHYEGEEDTVYIDVQSFCDKKCEISFDITDGNEVEFYEPVIKTSLNPLEKKSFPVKYKINKGYIYCKKAEINVKIEDETFSFFHEITSNFYTRDIKDYKVSAFKHEVTLGKFSMWLIMKDWYTGFYFGGPEKSGKRIVAKQPSFGKPYSDEFNKKEADKIDCYDEGNAVVLKADYSSKDFPGLSVTAFFKMYADGILEKWLKISNNRETDISEELFYCDKYDLYDETLIIPYKNKIIKTQNGVDDSYNYFDFSKITENWIFSERHDGTIGLTWPKEYQIKYIDWCFAFEHNLKGLKAGESLITKPIKGFVDLYNLEEFRKFIANSNKIEENQVIKTSELILNEGNPFIYDSFKAEIIDYKEKPLNVSVDLISKKDSFEKKNIKVNLEDKMFNASIEIPLKNKNTVEEVECKIRYTSQFLNYKKILFPVKEQKVIFGKTNENGKTVYFVDNGIIKFKSCPEFAPTIYSMEYNKKEWLDTPFPQTTSKSWWTPWVGGINGGFGDLSEKDILEEEITCDFVSVNDNFKNNWQGLKITVNINKNEKLKGISFEQYYLTLPDSAVIVNFVNIINNSGKFLDSHYYKLPFFKTPDEIKNTYWEYFNNNNDLCRFYLGYEGTDIRVDYDKIHSLNSENFEDKILFFHSKRHYQLQICGNPDTIVKYMEEWVKIPNNEKHIIGNEFMIFTDKRIEYKELLDLKNIKFVI